MIVLQSEYACIDKVDENNIKILHRFSDIDNLGMIYKLSMKTILKGHRGRIDG